MNFCWCGLPIKELPKASVCPKHGIAWRYEPKFKERIPKRSGKSKTPYAEGKYE